jgi:hypothetical protein
MARSSKAATSTKRKEGSRTIKKTSKAKAAEDAEETGRGKNKGPKRRGGRKSKVLKSPVNSESEKDGSDNSGSDSDGEDDVQVE